MYPKTGLKRTHQKFLVTVMKACVHTVRTEEFSMAVSDLSNNLCLHKTTANREVNGE
jgi:hypothetical protein